MIMILKTFTILDRKSQAFIRPFFVQNVAVARRAIFESRMDKNSEIAKYPFDYELWEIGEFDDQQGEIIPANAISHGLVSVIMSEENKALDRNRSLFDALSDAAPVQPSTSGGNSEVDVRPDSRPQDDV